MKLAWRVAHEGLRFFTADGGIAVVLTIPALNARKDSDDVRAYLCRVPLSITHTKYLIGSAHRLMPSFSTVLTHRTGALGGIRFLSIGLTTGTLVLFFFSFGLVLAPTLAPSSLLTITSAR